MFFRDLDMHIHPASSIQRMTFVEPPPHNKNAGYYHVELTNGETCRASYDQVDHLMRMGWRYVPATPGTVLLDRKEDKSVNDAFHQIPVLLWGVDEEGALQPFTSEGLTEARTWAVRTSDGIVSDQFGSSYPDEEAYLAALDSDEEG